MRRYHFQAATCYAGCAIIGGLATLAFAAQAAPVLAILAALAGTLCGWKAMLHGATASQYNHADKATRNTYL